VLTQDTKVVWYGKLTIDSKATHVVFDPLLTPSIKGCIYLYNEERDAIVQYTWKIVQGLLSDLDKNEKASQRKSLDAKWKAARKRLTKGKVYSTGSEDKAATPAPAIDTGESRWESTDDDAFELEDIG
jgi:hypothetical protein